MSFIVIYLPFVHNGLATALQGEPSARDNKSYKISQLIRQLPSNIAKIALHILCIKIYIIDDKISQNNKIEEETCLKIIGVFKEAILHTSGYGMVMNGETREIIYCHFLVKSHLNEYKKKENI